MKNNSIKTFIIIIVIALIFTGAYFLLKHYYSDDSDQTVLLKNYKVNEYIPTYVSDEDMAKIYLKDYIHAMYSDVNNAYKLLNEDYRSARFKTVDEYKKYVDSLGYPAYVVSRYYKKEKDGYVIFGIYDTYGNFYAFKTNGVMQYTVYLDENTIEI